MEIWELVARESIRHLVAGYAHAADRGRFEEVATLFGSQGVLELPDGRVLQGRDAIRAFLVDTAAAMKPANAPTVVRHHVASHRIAVQGPDAADGYAYFLVVTARGPDHWGRYVDHYTRDDDGEWRFARRRVRVDGRADSHP